MSAKPETSCGDPEAGDYQSNECTPPPVSRCGILSEQIQCTAEQSERHLHIKHDLRNTQTVDFADMLKAIMYRQGLPKDLKDAPGEIQKGFQSQKKEIDAEYDTLLGDAIELCNLDLSAVPRRVADRTPNQLLCQGIKADLKKYCKATTEKQRYIPLVNILNAILSFKNKNPQVIVVVNDPTIVQSDHLPTTSKRKPDIIKVSLTTFKQWLGLPENTDFAACQRLAGKIETSRKPSWIDVEQFWELKLSRTLTGLVTKGKLKFHREACSAGESVPSKGHATAVEAGSSALKRKRADDEDAESGKKPQKQPRADGCQIMPPPDEVSALNDAIQCGYYSIERFRATWQITHVSGVFLNDNFLNLLWYDPQGCIQSSRIDIVRQLPLLVLLVKLQQRSDFWSGYQETSIPPKYHMKDECAPRFRLVDHLPEVDDGILIQGTSTANIRCLLGLCTEGSRTQYLMFSKKLSSIRTMVRDTSRFKRVLFEIIRAHRLLWVLGIAHSDISFHNLMFDGQRGILNDFDLASTMDPGLSSPSKVGHRPTGTPIFMAIELLSKRGIEGHVLREYRHELESFAWVLLYATICVTNDGEENLGVLPFRDWVRLTPIDLGHQKTSFLGGKVMRELTEGHPYQQIILSTFRVWVEVYRNLQDMIHYDDRTQLPSDHFLLTQVLAALGFSSEEWVEFTISPEGTPLQF